MVLPFTMQEGSGLAVLHPGHAIKTTTVLCWLKKHIVVSQATGKGMS